MRVIEKAFPFSFSVSLRVCLLSKQIPVEVQFSQKCGYSRIAVLTHTLNFRYIYLIVLYYYF